MVSSSSLSAYIGQAESYLSVTVDSLTLCLPSDDDLGEYFSIFANTIPHIHALTLHSPPHSAFTPTLCTHHLTRHSPPHSAFTPSLCKVSKVVLISK